MRKVLVFLFIASASLIYNSCQKAAEKLAPKACFSFTPSTGIKAGDLVTFNSSCSENAATFNWDFGDGSTSTDASPTHTYTAAGDFTVKLEVKDAAGLSNSTTQTITVAASTNPIACFTYSPSTDIKAGTAITFHGGCSVNAATFHWDFGDGTTSTDSMVSHTFATANTFTVVLQVKNAAGAQDTASQIITVNSNVVTHSGNITANQIWYAGVHEITGEVYVDNGATLTIKPGAIIKFDLNTGLFIGYSGGTAGATLIANGKADSTILFTSAADTKTAGDWEYIGFYSGSSSNCSMKYCTVEYAGGVSYDGAIYLEHAKVTIENSYIQLSANSGLTLDNTSSFKSFTNDTVRENANYAIEIYGNYAHTIGLNNGLMTDKGVRVVGDTYTQANQTWNKLNCPYVIDGEEYIENATSAKLTLAPGVRIEFTQSSGIFVGYTSNNFGILIAEGTSTDSIYFTSAAPAGSKTAGDWEYLGFYSGAGSNSIMKYCAVDYGGGYSDNGSIYIDGSSVKIDNSRISNSLTSDIYCHNSGRFGSFTNNNVVISQTYPVIIDANEAHTLGTGNTYSDPGIFVNAATISANVTWLAQSAPYIINGDVYVESASGNTLTISAGTVVKFDQGSDIYVGYSSNTSGKLIALGTSTNGITFTTAASPGSESAGGWNGIFFEAGTASGSILDYCTISYGGGYGAPTSGNVTCDGVGAGRLTISNSTITNSAGFGIYIPSGSTPTLTTNIFTGNVGTDTGS